MWILSCGFAGGGVGNGAKRESVVSLFLSCFFSLHLVVVVHFSFFHHDRFFLQLLLLLLFIFVQIIDGGAMNQTDRACLLPTVRKGLEEVRQSLANFQYPEGCK